MYKRFNIMENENQFWKGDIKKITKGKTANWQANYKKLI